MAMTQHRVIQSLVEQGMKESDVSRVSREMFLHYESIGLMHQYLPRTGTVISSGTMTPEVMIVSDKPEHSEEIFGFSGFGMYGFYLMNLLDRVGIKISDVYWTQVFKEPVETINMSLIKDWYKYLHNEIVVTKPTVIIALGTTAISALAQQPIKIDKAIGEEFDFDLGNKSIPVIPVYHPRNFLDTEEFKARTNDLWGSIKPIADMLA